MRSHLVRSVLLTVVLLVLCGACYNAAGWALAQAAFRHQADGSLTANGSTLIGQPWSALSNGVPTIDPRWFQGRPDADNPLELDGQPGTSGAANLGPRSSVLVGDVQALVAAWRAVGIVHPTPDLVTTSGSGVDPNITPADATVQLPMVLRARPYLTRAELDALIARQTVGRQLGFLGSPYLVVLQLNEGLQALAAQHGHP
jgi:K+-transporting ATPase ATPase C chain